jgi:hypothetical protein
VVAMGMISPSHICVVLQSSVSHIAILVLDIVQESCTNPNILKSSPIYGI